MQLRLSSSVSLPPDTPSQRVQFILGTEDDAEHVAHELFTELDEICVKDGKDAEWKETARSGTLGTVSCRLHSRLLLFWNNSNGGKKKKTLPLSHFFPSQMAEV